MFTNVLKILIPVLRCQHKFYIEDIRLTGIEFKPKPIGRPYEEWSTYYSEFYRQPAITKKIACKCSKCGREFFAHCGLDLPGELKQKPNHKTQ